MDIPKIRHSVPSQGGEASWASWKCDGGVHTSDVLEPIYAESIPKMIGKLANYGRTGVDEPEFVSPDFRGEMPDLPG